MTSTFTLLPLHLASERLCPRCDGAKHSHVEADEDGCYGVPCAACLGTGDARYCQSCVTDHDCTRPELHVGGHDLHAHMLAVDELRLADARNVWRRVCARYECMGWAVAQLHALAAVANRPGLAPTRPESVKEQAC